jgi:hypothetical protein
MDTVVLVCIEGFDPAIEPWKQTEIANGRCVVSFHWTDTISDPNTRVITISFGRSESMLGNNRLVSCIKDSDGAHLITNNDILRICMAISPVTSDEEKLKAKWRVSRRGSDDRYTVTKKLRDPNTPPDKWPDNPLYKRLQAYQRPGVGALRRSVFICCDWDPEKIKQGLFTWLVRTLFCISFPQFIGLGHRQGTRH